MYIIFWTCILQAYQWTEHRKLKKVLKLYEYLLTISLFIFKEQIVLLKIMYR